MIPSTAITRYELSAPFSEFNTMANRQGFIGPQVLRPRLVGLQAADVGKIKLEQLMQSYDTARATGAGYKRSQAEFDRFSYSCTEHGHEVPIDDATLAIYRDMIDAEEVHSERAGNVVLQNYEIDVASAVYDTATWTGADLTTAVTNEWDDAANATPVDDVDSAREKVVNGSGLEPNALIVNRFQFRNLIKCNQILDRVKYTRTATYQEIATELAQVLDLKYILVAGGLKNTANPQQAAAMSRIWSNEYAMVARVAETDDPQEPCVGRTFIWTGDGVGAAGTNEELAVVVEEYREEKVRGSVIRARNNRDIVIMYASAAHLLSNITT